MNAQLEIVKQRWLKLMCLLLVLLALVLTTGGWAQASPLDELLEQKPVICKDQKYALCAGSRCFVFNDVAYCTCDVLKGDSISSPFTYDNGDVKGNVCTINAEGDDNGYIVSTFSLPKKKSMSIVAGPGNQAIYKCPRTSLADYAKCDGGICFTSTKGKTSLGFYTPLDDDQIVCSCPVTRTNPDRGVQIIGPYPCQEKFFENCERRVANNDNGSTLYDGSPIGSTEAAIRQLYGSVPPLNICR